VSLHRPDRNQESQNNIAAMLASHGISAHNVSCASVDAGEIVCRKLTGASNLNVGSMGFLGCVLALHSRLQADA